MVLTTHTLLLLMGGLPLVAPALHGAQLGVEEGEGRGGGRARGGDDLERVGLQHSQVAQASHVCTASHVCGS